MRNLLRPFEDLLCLLYPHLCLACGQRAPAYRQDLCTDCRATMPETNFHLEKDNPFTQRFWGRVDIHSGAALYEFSQKSRVQKLIHNLKYHGKRQVGVTVGRYYGHALLRSRHFWEAEIIVPVPLHPRKQRMRGYNQSEMFGQGLSESMHIPCLPKGLRRTVHTASQTQKNRLDRLQNMVGTFAVGKEKMLQGRHILLVDDVLTTGATLEACAQELLQLPGTKVSLATIAIATV